MIAFASHGHYRTVAHGDVAVGRDDRYRIPNPDEIRRNVEACFKATYANGSDSDLLHYIADLKAYFPIGREGAICVIDCHTHHEVDIYRARPGYLFSVARIQMMLLTCRAMGIGTLVTYTDGDPRWDDLLLPAGFVLGPDNGYVCHLADLHFHHEGGAVQ